jgi:dihydroorotase
MLPWLDKVLRDFPRLRVVLEHITTEDSVRFIREHASPRLAATITVHHLVLTLDDVLGDKLKPHNFCKPVAKLPGDRQALLAAACGKHEHRFFLGSDSAPHTVANKECAECCAGCFTAPVLPELLAEVFQRNGSLPELAAFSSIRANEFYGLAPRPGKLRMWEEPWTVPLTVAGDVRPFMGGKTIQWRAERIG